jgi:cytochrome P450
MVTLFQTSFSSTSIITLTILWILGEHPALQTKLRAELVSDLADDGPYLDAVFREGVRLSKLSSIGREAMEDTTLPFGRPVTLTDGRIIHELLLRTSPYSLAFAGWR